MRLPKIEGLIRRRLLLNFRVNPEVMQRHLPAPLRPKLHSGHAIAGICLIRLENIRPLGLPACAGMASENAAHRVAVVWPDNHGKMKEGVFIPRRDTSSRLNAWAGGKLFPGEHHLATFNVHDQDAAINLKIESEDAFTTIVLRGYETDRLPSESCFRTLADASNFFKPGSVGYSVTQDCCRLDGVELETDGWSVRPFAVEHVKSSFFEDPVRFPPGSVIFDHALIMRDLTHRWTSVDDLSVSAPLEARQ